MRRSFLLPALLTAACGILALPALAHDDTVADGSLADNRHLLHDPDLNDGHVPPNTNYGFTVIGRDTLGGESTAKYTDVWAHAGYAYVGTFEEPTCDRSGIYISAIGNPSSPETIGMIKSPPHTRINDVKVHEVDDRDVLIFTLEPCGPIVGRVANQLGQGGISLWDVTNPARPHALKQNFLDFPVHNTFPWTTAEGNSYLMVVNDIAVQDTHIIDITKPQSPKLITTTGILDWLPAVQADGQLFMGAFAAPLLHDIWVEQVNGHWQAVLSYWDAGFIVLDVDDPRNPVFLGDSTYPDPDPVHNISPPEGNAHAAVFGGSSGQFIFGGDEDFDAFQVTIKAGDETFIPTQGSDVPQITNETPLEGPTTYVGLACDATDVPAAPSPDHIAVIQRGACAFTTKAQHVQAAGYAAGIVFNRSEPPDNCETLISMLVEADIPMLFVARSAGFAILGIDGYDPDLCEPGGNPPLPAPGTGGLLADISADFDGWGYLHVLNNINGDVTVPVKGGDNKTVGYLGEIGYYAPAEVADPALATGAGDLTMHNLEIDPTERNRAFISWYSLGMRAVEWRPGHLHTNAMGEGVISWNVHEVGRYIAEDGSNFWGVHVTDIGGNQYVLGSDRNTGLWIFQFTCTGEAADNPALYCVQP